MLLSLWKTNAIFSCMKAFIYGVNETKLFQNKQLFFSTWSMLLSLWKTYAIFLTTKICICRVNKTKPVKFFKTKNAVSLLMNWYISSYAIEVRKNVIVSCVGWTKRSFSKKKTAEKHVLIIWYFAENYEAKYLPQSFNPKYTKAFFWR